MSDPEASIETSTDSSDLSDSPHGYSTPGSSPGSYHPADSGWPHPQAVKEVFYIRGITSPNVSSTGFESTEPELFHAVCDNNVALVEKLLVENHDPNAIFRLKIQFEGENMSYTQYPLHRAVQTSNKNLVDILLKHGSDPNYMDGQNRTPLQLLFHLIRSSSFLRAGDYSASGERHTSDPVIVEMLLKAGADITLDDKILTHIMEGPPVTFHRWYLLEMLVMAKTNVRNQLIEKCRNHVDDYSFVLFTLVTKCGEPDSNGKYGYSVLESCLKGGLQPDVLRHGLKLAIDHVVPNAVHLLIEAGTDVKFEFTDGQEKMVTPFHLALNLLTLTLDNLSRRSLLSDFSLALEVIYACGYIDSQLSVLWLLAKSGATSTWSRDIDCRLVQFEVVLKSTYEEVDRLFRENNWSTEHHTAAQNHLQRCLDILQEIQSPMNLLHRCCIAVRQTLGSRIKDKLDQLELPVPVKECILHYDLQAFVDRIARYERPGRSAVSRIERSLLSGYMFCIPHSHYLFDF